MDPKPTGQYVMPQQIVIPLALVGAFVVSVLAGYRWLDGQFTDTRDTATSLVQASEERLLNKIEEQSKKMEGLEREKNDVARQVAELSAHAESAYQDRYTATMAERDALRRALANPSILEPDPANPGTFLRVGGPSE